MHPWKNHQILDYQYVTKYNEILCIQWTKAIWFEFSAVIVSFSFWLSLSLSLLLLDPLFLLFSPCVRKYVMKFGESQSHPCQLVCLKEVLVPCAHLSHPIKNGHFIKTNSRTLELIHRTKQLNIKSKSKLLDLVWMVNTTVFRSMTMFTMKFHLIKFWFFYFDSNCSFTTSYTQLFKNLKELSKSSKTWN